VNQAKEAYEQEVKAAQAQYGQDTEAFKAKKLEYELKRKMALDDATAQHQANVRWHYAQQAAIQFGLMAAMSAAPSISYALVGVFVVL
jgi:hypothetical protein